MNKLYELSDLREDILSTTLDLSHDSRFDKSKQALLTEAIYSIDEAAVESLINRYNCNPNVNVYEQYETRNYGFLHALIELYYNNYTLRGESVLRIAEILLRAGADPNQEGSSSAAPIQRIESEKAKKFEELLLKYGARPEGNTLY